MDLNKRHINKIFVKQHDLSDCGVACLASIIQYYGGYFSLEELRAISGTTEQGTTLLGLFQAAPDVGLSAEAFEAEGLHHLKEVAMPVILHVCMKKRLSHYIVCYGKIKNKYLIGDPGSGIVEIAEDDLSEIWQSKALLTLTPDESFVLSGNLKHDKLRWFLNLLKEDIPLLSQALIIGIISTLLGMSTAIFYQKLIDNILPSKEVEKLVFGLIVLLILLLTRVGIFYFRGLLLVEQSKNFNIRMIGQFYDSLLYLPKLFFDTRKTGDLIARMNDTRRIQNTVSYLLSNVVIDILILVVSVSFVMFYSWQIGILFIGTFPIYLLLIWYFNSKLIEAQKGVMKAYAKNESNYIDTIQGIGTIKVMNHQSSFSRLTNSIYNFFQEKIYNLGKVNLSYNLISGCISVIIIVSVFGLASWLVLNESLQMGEMVAVLSVSASVIPSINRLVVANIQIKEATVAFDRMYEFASMEPEFAQEAKTSSSINFNTLIIKELNFRFKGRKRLLNNISLSFSKGEITTLLGESGCGKSTLLNILQKLYEPESGEIFLNQTINWSSIDHQSWRSIISVVPQNIKLFSGTLLDNISMDNTYKDADKIISFCKEYGFDRYFREFPQAYLTLLGENGVNISGGQEQLVALARALYTKPQFLLLDESTSAMDRKMEQFVLELFHKIKIDASIVMVTHRVKPTKHADKIYILEEGIVKHHGTPDTLMDGKNLYSASVADHIF